MPGAIQMCRSYAIERTLFELVRFQIIEWHVEMEIFDKLWRKMIANFDTFISTPGRQLF